MSGAVVVDDHDAIRVITLNRPEARNAIDRATAEAIAVALDGLDADDALRVGVITGAGNHFCAGMDLKAFPVEGVPIVNGRGFGGIAERAAEKPLIAAVEGWALAGGFEIALACDVIVAAQGARFGLPEVTRGLVAAAGGLTRLPRRIPQHVAMTMALTGDPIDAAAAFRYGLIGPPCPDGTALPTALDLARRIASNAPLAVRASKQVVDGAPDWPAAEAFARQAQFTAPVFASADALEGSRAFAERRPPVWQGR